jgi:hypothetical protein
MRNLVELRGRTLKNYEVAHELKIKARRDQIVEILQCERGHLAGAPRKALRGTPQTPHPAHLAEARHHAPS